MVSMPNVQQINSLCHIINMHICNTHARQVMPFNRATHLRTHPVICYFHSVFGVSSARLFRSSIIYIYLSATWNFTFFLHQKFEHTSYDIILIINGRLSPEYHKYKHKQDHVIIHTNRSTFIEMKDVPKPKVLFFPLPYIEAIDIARSMKYCRCIH